LKPVVEPQNRKGPAGTLRKGAAVRLVADLLEQADAFFANVERRARNSANGKGGTRRRVCQRPAGLGDATAMDRTAHPAGGIGDGQPDPAQSSGCARR